MKDQGVESKEAYFWVGEEDGWLICFVIRF